MTRTRRLLAAGSCALIVVAAAVGVVGTPGESGVLVLIVAIAVIVFAIQAAISDPSDLSVALLLSAWPVLAILEETPDSWLIGPLAVLLLLAGELNALSWASQGQEPLNAIARRRLAASFRLAGVALLASLGVSALGRTWVSGTGVAYVLGVAGLVGLAVMVFRLPRAGERRGG